MAKLLHILAAPRADGVSRTRKVAAAFFDAYRQAQPNATIDTLDLFATALPEMDALGGGGEVEAPGRGRVAGSGRPALGGD